MTALNIILEKIQNAKSLDFGDIFNDSFKLFQKTWLYGFLMQLFSVIIMLPIILIFYLPLLFLFVAQVESGAYESHVYDDFLAGFSLIYLMLIFAGIFFLSTLSTALIAGLHRIMKRIDFDEEVKASDLFYFFRGKYLSKLFLLLLANMGISVIALMLCVLPIFFVIVPLSYFTLVFAFNPDLGVGDMITISFKLGTKKWLLSFGLIFISSILISLIAGITCGLASIFIAAFIYHPTYFIYKEVVGFGTNDDDILRIDN